MFMRIIGLSTLLLYAGFAVAGSDCPPKWANMVYVFGTTSNDAISYGYDYAYVENRNTGALIRTYSKSPTQHWLILADKGNDLIIPVWGGGHDFSDLNGVQVCGGDGSDAITGSDERDYLYGDAGNDNVYAYDGNDFISGGSGSDYLFGSAGNDSIRGDAGDDYLYGDNISGPVGSDSLNGGSGNDWCKRGEYIHLCEYF